MTIKKRLEKLEGARRGRRGGPANVYRFTQGNYADGTFYFIDGEEVDAEKYAKEYAEYKRLHADDNAPGQLVAHFPFERSEYDYLPGERSEHDKQGYNVIRLIVPDADVPV
jgi:hypothetical protein